MKSAMAERLGWARVGTAVGVMVLCAQGTWAEDPIRTSAAATPWVRGVSADPWFWPDPYPHLGHDSAKGPGWEYVRIAADRGAGVDLQTTSQQQTALLDIFRQYEHRERDLGKKAREEGSDTTTRLAKRRELWWQAREAAQALLSAAQHRRVEQLMIQRASYHVFRSEDLVLRLELSEEQRRKITEVVAAHSRRIKEEDLELGRSTKRAAGEPEDARLAEEVRQLSAAKAQRGRLSHRRVWDEIREVFSAAQREQFIALRGPMAEPARQTLSHFEPRKGL